MAQIKDDLGREFISLPVLSSVLNLSTKQVRRHIRDKRMLNIKHGQKRYILKDDILREYPSLSPEALLRDIRELRQDNRDTIGTSVAENVVSDVDNVPDVSFKDEVTLYQKDQKADMMLAKIDQVKTVITRLEKSIADIGYIQQDTKTLDRKLDRVSNKLSHMEGQTGHRGHVVYSGVLIVIVLSVIGTSLYGMSQFNRLYKETQADHTAQISAKDEEITSVLEKHTNAVQRYEQRVGDKNITIEKLQGTLGQKDQEIVLLKETISKKEQEEALKKKKKGRSWI
ncbi:MAG: hypothetical protein ABIH85_02470 [Candidatus Omnitrophota bacterium]